MEYLESFFSHHPWITNVTDRLFRIVLIIAVVVTCAKLIKILGSQFRKLANQRPVEAGPAQDSRALDRAKRLNTVMKLIETSARVILLGAGLLMILRELGLDVTPLLTGAGIAGVAIGFGAQSLVKDVISGMFLLLEDQIRLGDTVRINAGLSGTVERMELRVTAIRDGDGTLHIIPNGEIRSVSNMTYEFGRALVELPISYKSDIEQVSRTIQAVLDKFKAEESWRLRLRGDPVFVGITAFNVGAMVVQVVAETDAGARWSVATELRRRIKIAFDAENIMPAGRATCYSSGCDIILK